MVVMMCRSTEPAKAGSAAGRRRQPARRWAGDLSARDRGHRFVEQGDALNHLSQRDQRLALAELAESSQVPLAEAGADLSSLAERGACAGGAASDAFVQNLRRGYYDIATDVPGRHRLRIAFDDLAITI
jgi:hypothetical protein